MSDEKEIVIKTEDGSEAVIGGTLDSKVTEEYALEFFHHPEFH